VGALGGHRSLQPPGCDDMANCEKALMDILDGVLEKNTGEFCEDMQTNSGLPGAFADDISDLPSVGSLGHTEGLCRPCAHFWKPSRCSKGRTCTFCHLCGEEDFQRRRKNNSLKRRAKRSQISQGDVLDLEGYRRSMSAPAMVDEALMEPAWVPISPHLQECEATMIELQAMPPHWPQTSGSGCATTTASSFWHWKQIKPARSFPDFCPPPMVACTLEPARVALIQNCSPEAATHHPAKDQAVVAGLPSIGSVGHADGTCRPCAHAWKLAGCSKGRSCEFCHACGQEDFQRKRKENAARRKAKRVLPVQEAQRRRRAIPIDER